MENKLLVFSLVFALWALVHSLTAARPFKRWVREKVGKRAYAGFYRLFYNAFSLVTFLPVLVLLGRGVPTRLLWRIPMPFFLLFVLIQIAGRVGLAVSLLQTNPLHFAGLSQLIRYLQGEEDPDPRGELVTGGVYRLVRHPLYFFSMLVLWFAPLMTLDIFAFNLLASLYFFVGALHEERRLAAEFGEAYLQYRREVPAFIPFLI